MKAMLDSDTCIYLMNGRPKVVAKEELHEYCISSVVMGELEFGHLNSNRRESSQAGIATWQSSRCRGRRGRSQGVCGCAAQREEANDRP